MSEGCPEIKARIRACFSNQEDVVLPWVGTYGPSQLLGALHLPQGLISAPVWPIPAPFAVSVSSAMTHPPPPHAQHPVCQLPAP